MKLRALLRLSSALLVLAVSIGGWAAADTAQDWTPTPNERIKLISTQHGFLYARYEPEDLQERAFPGGKLNLLIRIEVLPGQPRIVLDSYHQDVDPSGGSKIVVSPAPGTRFPLVPNEPPKTEPNLQGVDVEVVTYTCPLSIDAAAEPRRYPITLNFKPERPGAFAPFSAPFMVPVGVVANPRATSPHPLRIEPATETQVTVRSGGTARIPMWIYNGFNEYDVTIRGIEVSDANGLVEPIEYDPRNTRGLPRTTPPLPVFIPSRQWKKVSVPVHGTMFPFSALGPAMTKTPGVYVSLYYDDGFRSSVQTLPYATITFKHAYFWLLTAVGVLIGSTVGVLLRRKFFGTGTGTLPSQIGWVILLSGVFVLIAYAAQIEVVVSDDRRLLSYSDPLSAIVGCLLVGLSDPQEILNKVLTRLGLRGSKPAAPQEGS